MTTSPNNCSPEEQDLHTERMVLLEIVALHPDHLTLNELLVRMEDSPSDTDGVAIRDAVGALKRSGLVRVNGEVIEPTHPALRAAVVFRP